jgi:energy-coupling factor transport system ATP-binding protein
VREAARFVDLPEDMLETSPVELSGGIAAGVRAMRPEVLVLDEPTAGLDPRGRDSLLENIDAHHSELGAAVMIVTHIPLTYLARALLPILVPLFISAFCRRRRRTRMTKLGMAPRLADAVNGGGGDAAG